MIDPETIPECALQRLGGHLADLLDEDQWNNVEKNYLLPALEERESLRARVAELEADAKRREDLIQDNRERIQVLKARVAETKAKASSLRENLNHQ